MALAMSGVKFNEDILDFPAFKKKKEAGDFPFGQVPVLTLADGRCACTFLKVRVVACKTDKELFRNSSLVFLYLTLVAGTKIAQSLSIERFVAKYSGLYPDDPVAAAQVDAVLEAIGDLWKAAMTSTAGVDKNSPQFLEKREECAATGTQG